MPCYHPVDCYRAKSGGGIAFDSKNGYADLPLRISCGKCLGCRLDRSRQWAVRCVHEAQLHQANCFITLTYGPGNIPPGGSLDKTHPQKFIKRLRKRYSDRRISYFLCGEYGDQVERPHYHAILFGVDFADKTPFKKSPSGDQLYRSAELEKLWGLGFTLIGSVTFESAAYCARYVMKKVTGDAARRHYEVILPTGEILQRTPEYLAVSLKPAVGKAWFEQFKGDVYPDDFVVCRGSKAKVPRYYDKLFQASDVDAFRQIQIQRIERGATRENKLNSTPERLAVREEVATAWVSLHGGRNLEG